MNSEAEALEAALGAIGREGFGKANPSDVQMAQQLDPLLRTARAVKQWSYEAPSAATTIRIRAALQAIADQPRHRARLFARRTTWAIALALMILLLLGTTSAFASAEALPDSPFYPVRSLGERLQVTLADGASRRAGLHASFASQRTEQLRHVARQHKAISTHGLATLLRDVTGLTAQASREARAGDPKARAIVKDAEIAVAKGLKEIERDGNFSASEKERLDEAIGRVEADENAIDD